MKSFLEPADKIEHENISRSSKAPADIAWRAKILLLKDAGKSGEKIDKELNIYRHSADLWISKYSNHKKDDSIMNLLSISEGRGRKKDIPSEAKTWLISVAFKKSSKEYGKL